VTGVTTRMLEGDRGLPAMSMQTRTSLASESGQGLVEYGLILLLVAMVVVVLLPAIGLDVLKMFTAVSEKF
jgi:Flp pilus assembly pilin Flp